MHVKVKFLIKTSNFADTNMNIPFLHLAWYIFLGLAAVQLFYYLFFFSRLAFYRLKEDGGGREGKLPLLSVIICAKNEENNLSHNMPVILQQRYGNRSEDAEKNYEVIVVNDNSEDDTLFYLQHIKPGYPHFRFINLTQVAKGIPGKKYPLTVGIKGAIHDIIVLTDADCRPADRNWLYHIGRGFKGEKEIVLGYGAYERRPGLLNRMIRFETFFSGLQFLSFALAGIPYMGVGRNLAYKKELFFRHKGFVSHLNIPSGDDDLFINKAANRRNTTVVLHKEAITYSRPKEKWGEWYRQKTRHVSTGRHYKLYHQFLLGLFSLSLFLYYPFLVAALFYKPLFSVTLWIFLGKLLIQAIIWALSLKKLNEKGLFWYCLPLEILMSLYYLIFTPALLLKPKKRWN